MNSAAISSPGDGGPRPCSASDARKETSAWRSFAVSCAAICCAEGVCATTAAAPMNRAPVAAHSLLNIKTEWNIDLWLECSRVAFRFGGPPAGPNPPGGEHRCWCDRLDHLG